MTTEKVNWDWGWALYNAQCSTFIVHCILYNVQCSSYICTPNTVRCTLFVEHCTLYTAQCTSLTIHCTLYTVQCRVFILHCTRYTVQCSVYSAVEVCRHRSIGKAGSYPTGFPLHCTISHYTLRTVLHCTRNTLNIIQWTVHGIYFTLYSDHG